MNKTNIIIIAIFIIMIVGIVIEHSNDLDQIEKRQQNITKKHNQTIQEYQDKIEKMSAINYNPTLEEVKQAIKNLDYSDIEYRTPEFNCLDYTFKLMEDLREEGIYSCSSEIRFDDGAHALVVVNTTDGIIYIEPQEIGWNYGNKFIKSLEVGDNFCDKVNWECDWEITFIKNCFEYGKVE
ncbi:MAG: hypothetical protein ACOC56_04740 [Atribacterota bacterium]